MIRKIILVFKTHFDFGFTDLAANVAKQYAGRMLEDVISACNDTSSLDKLHFVFTLPAWPLHVMLESGQHTATLVELIQQGQVAWHALPFTSHTDFAGLEDTIEGLKYARTLSHRFGKPLVKSAKMTDVPGHGNILPAVLAGAGVKFLHLGSNEYPVTPQVPPLFFWQAPDGSRVLTMYYPDGYGSSELMPEDWPFPVWMAMMHTHDNNGPQSPDDIRVLVAKAQAEHPEVEIVSGTMDDFYNALADCDLSSLPVVTGDLADSWIHGVGSYPKEVAMVRDTRQILDAAEKTAALDAAGENNGWRQRVADAWDGLILFDEHTWGLDVKTWMDHARVYEKQAFLGRKGTEEYRRMEASWTEQRQRASNSFAEAAEALAGVCKGEDACLLNPSAAPFTGWARVEGGQALQNATTLFGEQYIYVQNALPLALTPLARVSTAGSGAAPALRATEDGLKLFENHRYGIYFNGDTGMVHRVYDKTLGADILAARGGRGVFSYQYSVYGSGDIQAYLDAYCSIDSDWGVLDNGRTNYPPETGGHWQPAFEGWHVEGSTLSLCYRGAQPEAYGDAKAVKLRLTLPAEGEELFCELLLEDKQETPYIESGSLVLPLACGAGQKAEYRINKNGTLLDPRTGIVEGANHVFYCLEGFATAWGADAGVCVVPHHTPLMAIGETGVLAYRQNWRENEPSLIFNLFNNMWGTNFPQWMGGSYRYAFTLYGIASGQNTTQRALALYQGARVLPARAAQSPFVLPEQVYASRMKPYKGGVLLRLRDTGGEARDVTVSLAQEGMVLRKMDLQNRPTGEAIGAQYSGPLGAYGLLTLWAGTAEAAALL